MQNYYKILGVKITSSTEEIKKAYIDLIKKYHPDTYKGDKVFAENQTALITEAYTTLKDIDLRAKYDKKFSSNTQTFKEEKVKEKPIKQKPVKPPKQKIKKVKIKKEKVKKVKPEKIKEKNIETNYTKEKKNIDGNNSSNFEKPFEVNNKEPKNNKQDKKAKKQKLALDICILLLVAIIIVCIILIPKK